MSGESSFLLGLAILRKGDNLDIYGSQLEIIIKLNPKK